MSYVPTFDNKYVQYFLTNDEWSVIDSDWERMDLEKQLYGETVTFYPDGNIRPLFKELVEGDIVCYIGDSNDIVVGLYDNNGVKIVDLTQLSIPYTVTQTISKASSITSGILVINSELKKPVLRPSDIVNNLNSNSIDKPLSARQGRVLNEKIPTVINDLTSESTSSALSAKQGKTLNDRLSPIETSVTGKTVTFRNDGNIRPLSEPITEGEIIVDVHGTGADLYEASGSTFYVRINSSNIPYTVPSGITLTRAAATPSYSTGEIQLAGEVYGTLKTWDVINNLTSTDTDKPLSANQGRVLNNQIPSVINNLTSESTTSALSAKQGKTLNEKFGTVISARASGQIVQLDNPIPVGSIIVALNIATVGIYSDATTRITGLRTFDLPYKVTTPITHIAATQTGVYWLEISILGGLNKWSEGGSVHIAYCNTNSDVAVKVITTDASYTPGNSLLIVKLPANTNTMPAFDVNEIGLKRIIYRGVLIESDSAIWSAGWYMIFFDTDMGYYQLFDFQNPDTSVIQGSNNVVTGGAVYTAIQNAAGTEEVDIEVPDTIYAVVGDTLQIYFNSIFKVANYTNYDYAAICEIGAQYPRYYELIPTAAQVGNHNITFRIRNNSATIVGEKTVTLKVVNPTAQPANNVNVLCVGSSLTSGGQWPAELKRRLTGSGGTPAGKNFSNITFVGRNSAAVNGTTVNFEATGGYRLATYTSATSMLYHFYFTAQSPAGVVELENTYSDGSGHTLTVTEINLTEGVGNISCTCDSNYEQSGSGTLTKLSGTGDATLSYSSSSVLGNPFVYNGSISLQSYANEHCNGTIDIVSISELVCSELLNRGGNSEYKTDVSPQITYLNAFVSMFRSAFPNVKFVVAMPALPDVRGGLGANYGATGNTSIPYGLRISWFSLSEGIKKYISDNSLEDVIYVMNWLGETDAENDYPSTTKTVNPRSSVTEVIGTNGIHPSIIGYNQFADSAYRCFCANLL